MKEQNEDFETSASMLGIGAIPPAFGPAGAR
jgi:hypothetical protein